MFLNKQQIELFYIITDLEVGFSTSANLMTVVLTLLFLLPLCLNPRKLLNVNQNNRCLKVENLLVT